MSEIIFIYKENEIPIQYSKGEKMKDIIERLSNKINISKIYQKIIYMDYIMGEY